MITRKIKIYGVVAIIIMIMAAIVAYVFTDRDMTVSTLKPPVLEVKFVYFPAAVPHSQFPILVAKEMGFFKEEGLEIKLVEGTGGMVVPGLLRGDLDYEGYGLEAIAASLKNADLKAVALISRGPNYLLVAQPGLEINDIKTMAISSKHVPRHYVTLKFIEEHDLDVEIIVTESHLAIPGLLVRGGIDATFTHDFEAFRLQAEGFTILKESSLLSPAVLTTRGTKIENNPEEVRAVINALQKAAKFILEADSEKIAELLLKHYRLEETEENLELAKEILPHILTSIDRSDLELYEGIEILIKNAKAGAYETLQDIEKQAVTQGDIDKAFDFRFLKQNER